MGSSVRAIDLKETIPQDGAGTMTRFYNFENFSRRSAHEEDVLFVVAGCVDGGLRSRTDTGADSYP